MTNYATLAGLEFLGKLSKNSIVEEALVQIKDSFSSSEIEQLYHYDIPEIVEGSGCGLKASDPYRLEDTLKLDPNTLESQANTLRLFRLNYIIKEIQTLTGVDWIGIYRKTVSLSGEEILLKEAYYGRFSRVEFPLNETFAQGSNNSTVGLSGKAITVQNVADYAGPYYTCDTQVQSEFCLPIFNQDNEVIGIIDAEAFTPHFFSDQKLREIAKVAADLGKFSKQLLTV